MDQSIGFQQWLSIYTLALDPKADALLLDRPDAILDCSLHESLMERLGGLDTKQVLVTSRSAALTA